MIYEAIRKDVCDANRTLEKNELVFLGRGEVSGIDRERGVVVVKPAAIPHADLTPEDMLVLDLSGAIVEGNLLPGPDAITHLHLYQSWTAVNAIASLYSTYVSMFAQALRPIPCLGATHAAHFKGEIPVTRVLRKPELERSYEKSLAALILEKLGRLNPLEVPAALVANHGAMAWGKTLRDAGQKALAAERLARVAFGTLQLAPTIQPIPAMLMDRSFSDHA
ncbi:MAG: class II aldolase/adducin family protein [bacterium]